MMHSWHFELRKHGEENGELVEGTLSSADADTQDKALQILAHQYGTKAALTAIIWTPGQAESSGEMG